MKKQKPRTFDGMAAAAAAMDEPLSEIQRAKRGGCTGFRSNRVYEDEVREWLDAHPIEEAEIDLDPKSAKLREEVRRLRLMNDAKEGRLIERSSVTQAIQAVAGDINALRIKSEAEHSTRFAETHGDQAQCRVILKKIWDEISASIQSLESRLPE